MNWGWYIFVQRQRIQTVMAQAIDNEECFKPDSYKAEDLKRRKKSKNKKIDPDSNLTWAQT